ncbi:FkbM family methyltransferase [Candidatus Pelagibacter communis]|uniref:FkbM family methyltransferase n=1 Tax=Pelagibacter ubique TaxID=198252 RepID=UPI00094D9BEF|nr:FkbM family methyltransferase [Candidatus Pelagibacter ubique]
MPFIKLVIKLLNFFDNFRQKKIIKLINLKIKKPMIIFDVGSHHGETIDIFKKYFNYEKIYSFEASPLNYKILIKNFKKKNNKNIIVYNYALGSDESDKYINQTLESSSSTINSLNQNSKYYSRKLKMLNIKNKKKYFIKIPVKMTTLDKFITKNNIKTIDLLKIDTEGYELNILKGLLIHYNKVKLIYFEHHYDDMIEKKYTFTDINKLLVSYGFKMIKKNKMVFRKSFEYVYENLKN